MVTVFAPTSSGIVAVHCAAPEAVPEAPVFVDQVTDAIPALLAAVPLKGIDAAVVETEVAAGDAMTSAGGPVGPGGVEVNSRDTLNACETFVALSDATTVMRLAPVTSGIGGMVQEDEPCAEPEAPRSVDQVTAIFPLPPDTEPLIAIATAVVVGAGGFTVSVSTVGVGDVVVWAA